MITAQRILDELGTSAWSGFSADDMIFSSTDSKQALTELNSLTGVPIPAPLSSILGKAAIHTEVIDKWEMDSAVLKLASL